MKLVQMLLSAKYSKETFNLTFIIVNPFSMKCNSQLEDIKVMLIFPILEETNL